jgi:hypothetical protein
VFIGGSVREAINQGRGTHGCQEESEQGNAHPKSLENWLWENSAAPGRTIPGLEIGDTFGYF